MKKIVYNKFNTGILKPELLSRSDSPIYNAALQYSDNFTINTTGQISFRTGFELLFSTYKNKKAWYLSFKNVLFEMTEKHLRSIRLDLINSEDPAEPFPFVYDFRATIDQVRVTDNNATIHFSTISKGSMSNLKVQEELLIKYTDFSNTSDYSPVYTINNYTIITLDAASQTVTVDITNKNMIQGTSEAISTTFSDSTKFPYTEAQLATISTVKIDDGILIAHPDYNIKYIKIDEKTLAVTITDYLTSSTGLPAPASGITLYEGRLYCVGKNWLFASKVGNFQDFSFGTSADSAFKFQVTNTNREEPHEFYWLLGTNKALYAGSKYGIIQVTGNNTTDTPISATSVNIKPVGNINSANIQPVHYLDYVVYATSSEQSLRLIDYSPFGEGSRNIPVTEYTNLFVQKNVQSMNLIRTDNNYILALTKNGEIIYGFIEFAESGVFGSWVLWSMDIGVITSIYVVGDSDVFASVDINGLCYTQRLSKLQLMPNKFEYQTSANEKADTDRFNKALLVANKKNRFLDSFVNFNAFTIAKTTSAKDVTFTITNENTITASRAFFNDSWLLTPIAFKQDDGLNIIVQPVKIVSNTKIEYFVLSINKPVVGTVFAAGDWGRGTKKITNLPLNDVNLTLIADNGDYYEQNLTNGTIYMIDNTINLSNDFIFKAYVGIKYVGRLVTIPFSSLDEKKNIAEIKFQLLNSHKFSIGRDFYHQSDIKLTRQLRISGQPFIPYTGNYSLRIENMDWLKQSGLYLLHSRPDALNILHIAVYFQEN